MAMPNATATTSQHIPAAAAATQALDAADRFSTANERSLRRLSASLQLHCRLGLPYNDADYSPRQREHVRSQ